MGRCILCGGKLSSKGKCVECGLDNTKGDKKYRLNVHNEKTVRLHGGDCEDNLNRDNSPKKAGERRQADAAKKKAKERRQAGTVKKKGSIAGKTKRAVAVIVIFELFLAGLQLVPELLDELKLQDFGVETMDQMNELTEVSKPERVEWARSDSGYFEAKLAPGFYEVGYEIPAGRYQLYCEEGTAWISCSRTDGEMLYMNLKSVEEQKAYEEVWEEACTDFELSEEYELSDGDVLYIRDCDAGIRIAGIGEGAAALRAREPQDGVETVVLEQGMTAGEDFAEGVYDIVLDGGTECRYVFAWLEIQSPDGEEGEYYIDLDEDGSTFRHFPFQEGDTVGIGIYGNADDAKVSLIPSY